MRQHIIFTTIARIVLPFLYIFGLYIIMFGAHTPGGGFQGGVIFATGFLIEYLIQKEKTHDLKYFAKREKQLFILLFFFSLISYFSKGEGFTNFIPDHFTEGKSIFYLLLNVLIGLKVSLGIITIIVTFLEEGE